MDERLDDDAARGATRRLAFRSARRRLLGLLFAAASIAAADPPRTSSLSVRVEPPLDPFGEPWRVQLLAAGRETPEEKPELVAEEPSPMTKPLALRTLPDRPYRLRLLSSRGDVWQTDPAPFVVGDGLARLLEPKALPVRGSVVVGLRPLANARLTFTSEGRSESVALLGDEKGIVSGVLPRLGRWHVVASAEVPRLRREVDAEVVRNPRGNELDFEVNLIPKGIEGEFVDINGERITRPVFLGPGRPRTSHDSQEPILGGRFRVEWLENGDHFMRAFTSHLGPDGRRQALESGPIPVTVFVGTADPAWLTLVLRRSLEMKGRVVTSGGAGVPNAGVARLDAVGSAESRLSTGFRTDAEGRFVLGVPEGFDEACVAVGAVGIAGAVARVVPTAEEVVVPIEGPGGTIVLDQPYLGARRLDGRVVALFHRGCAFRPGGFPYFRGVRPAPSRFSRIDTGPRWRSTMTTLEPGAYSACPVTWADLEAYRGGPPAFADCVHGTLPPGGTLELTLLP